MVLHTNYVVYNIYSGIIVSSPVRRGWCGFETEIVVGGANDCRARMSVEQPPPPVAECGGGGEEGGSSFSLFIIDR